MSKTFKLIGVVVISSEPTVLGQFVSALRFARLYNGNTLVSHGV